MPVEDDHFVYNYCTYPDNKNDPRCEPLYTHPLKQKPLTDEQINEIWDGHIIHWKDINKTIINPIVFARAFEKYHGIGE